MTRTPSLLWLAAAFFAVGCAGARPAPVAKEPTPREPTPRTARTLAGENACQAAGRLGVSPEALLAANQLSQPPEQPLRRAQIAVPSDASLRHRVRAGDTLGAVAAWYGQPLAALARLNGIADADRIAADSWLRIPAGARTGCPPPPVVASAPVVRAVAKPAPRAVAARARPAPERRALSREQLARADDLLERASRRYDAADFRGVVVLTRDARTLLGAHAEPASAERRARAAWLEGLALAGLAENDAAVASLREALALRPQLRDDPDLSPRIRELLETAPVPAHVAAEP